MLSQTARLSSTGCWTFAVALLVGAIAPGTVEAQGRSTLYGRVTDASGAVLPGVTVTVASPHLIKGQETAVTNESGQWRIPALTPGVYRVTAELPGFATALRENINLEAGAQIAVDFTLSLAGVQETVTVAGDAGMVDVRSARKVHTVDTKLIEDVPLTGRTYADVINALPGITDGSKYTYSLTQTVHGSGVRDNDYVIDGQSTKHTSGYSGTEFSIEAIEAVQVTTGGISAEFGQASGGIFTFVTKSGGDEFRGSVYGYLIDEAVQGKNVSDAMVRQGVDPDTGIIRDTNWGANLGGPIKKQRLWFFADFNRSSSEERFAGFPLAPVEEWKRLIFTKGTWQVSGNNRLQGSFNHQRRWMLPSNPGAEYRLDPRAWRKQYWLPKVTSIQWTSVLGAKTILEAQGGKLKVVEDNTFPLGSFDPSEVNGYEDIGSGIRYGTWDRARGRFDGRDHWDLKANISHFADDLLGGTHEFKAGIHREKGWNQRWNVIPNNLLMRLRSAPTCLSLDCAVPLDVSLHAGPTDTRDEYVIWAGYVQDQFTLDRVTINAGVRFEYTNGWTPEQRQGADLVPNGFDPDLDGKRNTFPVIAWFPSQIFPERRDLIDWKSIAPRLGVSWDTVGNSRFVVKGSYGRWHNKVGQEVGSGNPNSLRNNRYEWLDCRDAAGTPISCQGLPASQVNGDLRFQPEEQGRLLSRGVRTPEDFVGVVTHDPDLKQAYVDAVNIGFEVGLRQNLSVGVSGIYKKYGNIIGSLDPTRRPFDQNFDPVQVTNPVTGQAMTIYLENPALGSVATQTFLSNPPEAKGSYKGIEFVARKRYSNNWQLFASYLYGQARGNIGTHFNDGIGYNVTNPNQLINTDGPLSLDAPHQIKINGSMLLPWRVNVGLSYLGISGYPWRSFVSEIGGTFGGASYFQFIRGVHYPVRNAQGVQYREAQILLPVEPRGTHRVDFRNVLNVRAEKTFALPGGRRIGAMVDVLNVFNTAAVTHIQNQRIEFVNYGLPELIEAPVRARFGLRFMF
jgi:hypothetical protein